MYTASGLTIKIKEWRFLSDRFFTYETKDPELREILARNGFAWEEEVEYQVFNWQLSNIKIENEVDINESDVSVQLIYHNPKLLDDLY
jgi:hypothetical protein